MAQKDTPMMGQHRFHAGQRVRPSREGVEACIFPRTRAEACGTVQKVDEFNSPSVLWDYRRTVASYHPDFVEPADKSLEDRR